MRSIGIGQQLSSYDPKPTASTPVLPRNLLEMHIIRPHSYLTKSKTLGVRPNNLSFNKSYRSVICKLFLLKVILYIILEKEMATHSSTLAWRIPWTEEPGRLQSMGLQRVGHDWATNTHIVDLQCCVSFCYIAKWISYIYIYIHSFSDSIPI